MTHKLFSVSVRFSITLLGLALLWQAIVWITGAPPYILPSPISVLKIMVGNAEFLLFHTGVTALEILLGLVFGTLLGISSAVLVHQMRSVRRWLMPILVVSQAIPVFALAPVLVLWLGYGLLSKVAMATIIIYFPITASFLDGLRQTEIGWLNLARTMVPGKKRRAWASLVHLRIPAALPALASGLRVAAAVAPIGAIVGEWVGASAGLGYVMLHSNGRMQTDLMFAALISLAILALLIYSAIDNLARYALPWQADSMPDDLNKTVDSHPSH